MRGTRPIVPCCDIIEVQQVAFFRGKTRAGKPELQEDSSAVAKRPVISIYQRFKTPLLLVLVLVIENHPGNRIAHPRTPVRGWPVGRSISVYQRS